MIKIIESPREGMQSLEHVIPTGRKVEYLNTLLKVGFDTVEVGSIVSPKLVPQMADSVTVIESLDFPATRSNRMVLAVNTKGAEIASGLRGITHISYPFSFSDTFLKLNLNTTVNKSFDTVKAIQEICEQTGKKAVIYISMAFGNPYGDPWSIDLLAEWAGRLAEINISVIPLSNVAIEIGPEQIREVFSCLVPRFPAVEFGLHLHTTGRDWEDSLKAAWDSGCRRFDSVINGYGGCPMSGKEMLGNLKTENLLEFSEEINQYPDLDRETLALAYRMVPAIFSPGNGKGTTF
jgi:hydroxymethylglutaryl-CoA lyase